MYSLVVGEHAHILLLLRGFPDSEWEVVVQDMTQKVPSFWKGAVLLEGKVVCQVQKPL